MVDIATTIPNTIPPVFWSRIWYGRMPGTPKASLPKLPALSKNCSEDSAGILGLLDIG